MITIRKAVEADFDAIWPIFHQVVQQGDSYAFDPDTTREQAYSIWMGSELTTYVASIADEIVGTYILKANQPGLGSHVANAGYMVDIHGRGKGVGRAMCEHSVAEARKMGFYAMQFNMVVSTNESAVALWKQFGFTIVGTLPQAFRHRQLGLVDAYVMHRFL
ncbi:MAG TPA: N-acetyltransferase [Pyrinomonadaceae bacterium]|nr:N-acetyltransferase [Pyrinomonadaceae bacterium]